MELRLSADRLEEVASKLRAIAHPMRITIMDLLERKGEMNVTEIYEELKIEQVTASHHLSILEKKRVLASRRDGKKTYYSIKEDSLIRIAECISKCETK